MDAKSELLKLVNELPEDKLPAAMLALRSVIDDSLALPSQLGNYSTDQLYQFLKIFVTSMNNSLYDLSSEANRKGEKIVAKKLDFSRKKMLEAWANFKPANE